MRSRQLGHSGLKVSELCLGTMTFGEESGFGAPEAECRRMFDAYREAGGNFLDTANIYSGGSSERILAGLVAAERDRLVVASKFSMTTDPRDPNAGGNSRKNLRQSLEATLRRLGTDRIDLYWVHAWDGITPPDELLRALDDAVRAGKVLYTGFSNVPAWVVARAQAIAELRGWTRFAALQLHYSLVERTVERELLPCAAALGLAVTAWSPLGGGVLSGKYSNDPAVRATQPGRLTSSGWGRTLLSDRNLAIAEAVKAVATATGRPASQVALRWLLQRRDGVIPIVGARNLAQLSELLGATSFELDAAALATLDEASRIELGYPKALLDGPAGLRMVHGEAHEALIRSR
ncbi:MAG: aldo/keto reductase [Steroidobacteraceae bacterium]|jgi:aryl-alcohol dehydrogenase-like predicted oxidoreductase|nr:aldo/keto reductase [Steroidobacteraceae bacterium]